MLKKNKFAYIFLVFVNLVIEWELSPDRKQACNGVKKITSSTGICLKDIAHNPREDCSRNDGTYMIHSHWRSMNLLNGFSR